MNIIRYFIMADKFRHEDGTIEEDVILATTLNPKMAERNYLLWRDEPECIGQVIIRPVKS